MEEYIKAKIEVSILTPPKAVEFKGKRDLKKLVRPKEDGVILQVGDKRATYLPSVWEQIPDFNEFFTSLATKAGIEGDPFKQSPVVYLYQTEKFKEA
jgi:AMMECR1 domain-containing protein